MALRIPLFQAVQNAYLKAVPSTLRDEIVEGEKAYHVHVTYYIYYGKGGELVFVDSFEMPFNPEESIHAQVYGKMYEKFPDASEV